jgi:hypothetical protein
MSRRVRIFFRAHRSDTPANVEWQMTGAAAQGQRAIRRQRVEAPLVWLSVDGRLTFTKVFASARHNEARRNRCACVIRPHCGHAEWIYFTASLFA